MYLDYEPESGLDLPGYCDIEADVDPRSSRDAADVMLVQFLLAQLWTSPFVGTPDQRDEAQSIVLSVTQKGGRWDDGIYGHSTRRVAALFEQAAFAPSKDGIFRAGTNPDPDWNGSKMQKLNFVFVNQTGTRSEQERLFRMAANPILARRMIRTE